MSHIPRVFRILSLLGMLAGLAPANAAQIQLNGNSPYKCIAVENGNTANGTPVILYSCSGGPEDRWNYGDGQFQGIGTANGVTMCLDVKGQGTTAGTLVDLYQCNGKQNQQWELSGNGEIYGVQSGMCLDSKGGPSVGGGTQLVINPCSSTAASQVWLVRGMQFQLNGNAPYNCITVNGGDTANGTAVISYNGGDAPPQVWNYIKDQLQGIGTNNGNSTCLTASGLTAGSLVTLSSCVTSEVTQEWVMYNGTIFGRPSSSEIVLSSGLCLDSSGGPSVGGGTQLVVETCTGAGSQNWDIR